MHWSWQSKSSAFLWVTLCVTFWISNISSRKKTPPNFYLLSYKCSLSFSSLLSWWYTFVVIWPLLSGTYLYPYIKRLVNISQWWEQETFWGIHIVVRRTSIKADPSGWRRSCRVLPQGRNFGECKMKVPASNTGILFCPDAWEVQ